MMEISAAFQSFNTAKDIIKSLMKLKAFADHQDILIALKDSVISAQNTTLELQTENAALLQQKDNLEKEIMRFETWETEKQRYELKEVGPSVVAYVTKESMRGSEPVHWLCCHCYQSGHKGFFQLAQDSMAGKTYACQTCKSPIRIRNPAQTQRPPSQPHAYGF